MEHATNIHEIIKALLDVSKPFPPTMLYQLSDLDQTECRVLREVWQQITLLRRRALLDDLSDLAEHDNLLMFEEVGRIALDDPDCDVVVSAIDLLFQSEDRRLIPIYLKMLTQTELGEVVRAAAANALGPFVYLGEVDQLDPAVLNSIEEALLKAHAQDESDLVKRRALESLGYSSRDEVPPLLRLASLRDESAWLESALFAMGKSADDQWAGTVLANLAHENETVRLQAVHASGELALAKARTRLLRQLSPLPANRDMLHETLWALSQIGGDQVEETFEKLLEQLDDEEALQWLEEALDVLSLTEDKTLFDMLEYDYPHAHADEDEDSDELISEDETEFHHSRDFDDEEWQRYIDDDDLDFPDEEPLGFDEDEEDLDDFDR